MCHAGAPVSGLGPWGSARDMRHLLMAWCLAAFLVLVGIGAVLLPVQTKGKDCGGTPITIVGRAVPFDHFDPAESVDCHNEAEGSIIVGAITAGLGLVGAVAAILMVRRLDS